MSQAAVIRPCERSRGRHWTYLEAHELTLQGAFSPDSLDFFEDAWGQGQEIERLAGLYQRDIQDKGIVLANEIDDRILTLPYHTRFSPEYYPEVARKLRRLIDFDDGVLLTLTNDPRLRSCLFDAKQALLEGWADLRNVMGKDVERGSGHVVGWDKNYIGVLEFQKSGNPHLHILLKNCRWIDVDWLRSLWEEKYGVGTFVNVERVQNNRKRVVNYLLKYLFKARDDPRHLALLWALNARAFICSRGILDTSKTNCDKSGGRSGVEWFLVGIFPLDRCKDFKTRADLLRFLDT